MEKILEEIGRLDLFSNEERRTRQYAAQEVLPVAQ